MLKQQAASQKGVPSFRDVKRVLASVVLLCALFTTAMYARPSYANTASNPVVVSLGDSYSSGEGVEPFYGQDSSSKYEDDDWLAHRSTLVWSGQLKVGGQQLSSARGTRWHFVASSGAVTKHITTTGQEKTWKTKEGFLGRTVNSGSKTLPVQNEVFSKNGLKDKVTYVTLSIGGNDLGFEHIVSTAAKQDLPFVSSGNLQTEISKALDKYEDSVQQDMVDTYNEVLKEAGSEATLIVVGYPRLVYHDVSDLLFSKDEAKLLSDAVDVFDVETRKRVEALNNNRIVFCDPRLAFAGHESYAPTSYINEVKLGAQAQDLDQTIGMLDPSSYSMHPNKKGQTAYASAVQEVIDELEDKRLNATNKNTDSSAQPDATNPTDGTDAPVIAGEVSMALVFDTSGSMDDPSGMTNMSKLESARRQSSDFVETIRRQASSGELSAHMSVSSFANEADTACSMTDDFDNVLAGIIDLDASGSTNMYAGLSEGIAQLSEAPGQKIIVFLSDGLNNTGASRGDIIDLAHQAEAEGIRIYTIGFGSSYDIDEDLLQEIADITHGSYSHEDSSSLSAATVGLFGALMNAQLSSTGEILISGVGSVRQGEMTQVGTFEVKDAGNIGVYLYWPGSQLDLRITDPDGMEVTEGYAGYQIDTSSIPTQVKITNAKQGSWDLQVYGAEVSMEEEPFYAAVSYNESTNVAAPVAGGGGGGASNHGEGLLFLLLAVAVVSIGGVFALSLRKRSE